VAGCCEHRYKYLNYIKGGEFLDHVIKCEALQGGGEMQNLKVKCCLREMDNQKHEKVQTKLIRLRLDGGLSSCEEDVKPSD